MTVVPSSVDQKSRRVREQLNVDIGTFTVAASGAVDSATVGIPISSFQPELVEPCCCCFGEWHLGVEMSIHGSVRPLNAVASSTGAHVSM